jgi:pyrroline-5-carboxylate reductase
MTREGLNVLDEDGALAKLLTATLAATRDRGAALSSSSD